MAVVISWLILGSQNIDRWNTAGYPGSAGSYSSIFLRTLSSQIESYHHHHQGISKVPEYVFWTNLQSSLICPLKKAPGPRNPLKSLRMHNSTMEIRFTVASIVGQSCNYNIMFIFRCNLMEIHIHVHIIVHRVIYRICIYIYSIYVIIMNISNHAHQFYISSFTKHFNHTGLSETEKLWKSPKIW